MAMRAIAPKISASGRFDFHCVMRAAAPTSAETTELIICQGFGEVGRSSGSSSKLLTILWSSMVASLYRFRLRLLFPSPGLTSTFAERESRCKLPRPDCAGIIRRGTRPRRSRWSGVEFVGDNSRQEFGTYPIQLFGPLPPTCRGWRVRSLFAKLAVLVLKFGR